LEQAEVSGAWPVSRSWDAFVRGVYSLRDDKALERFVGFEYRACCWRARFGGRRFVSTHTGSQDTGVFLQLELTGLASVGSASDAFLTEAIRGYARPEARAPPAERSAPAGAGTPRAAGDPDATRQPGGAESARRGLEQRAAGRGAAQRHDSVAVAASPRSAGHRLPWLPRRDAQGAH